MKLIRLSTFNTSRWAIPIRAAQMAEIAFLAGNTEEGKSILSQNGLIFRAIKHSFAQLEQVWIQLLNLTHNDTVLFGRIQYHEALGRSETNDAFLAIKDEVQVTAEQSPRKIQAEHEHEKTVGN